MSMNVYFVATREIRIVKTDRLELQSETAEWKRTPTKVSYEILNSPNQIEAYREWVKGAGNQYADHADRYLEEFDGWCKEMQEKGYDILCEVW